MDNQVALDCGAELMGHTIEVGHADKHFWNRTWVSLEEGNFSLLLDLFVNGASPDDFFVHDPMLLFALDLQLVLVWHFLAVYDRHVSWVFRHLDVCDGKLEVWH